MTVPAIAVVGMLWAAAQAAVLPDTEPGRRVGGYVDAFNSGDAQRMAAYLDANLSAAAIAERSVAERLTRWKTLHDMLGRLTPVKVLDARPDRIEVEMRCANDEMATFIFELESAAPHKVTSIGARIGGPQDRVDLPDIPPAGLDGWLSALAAQDRFSGVVMVRRNGRTVFEKAYGMADRAAAAPNRIDTKFNLGSMNKIMTKIAIAKLAEKGKLEASDTIGKFLPDYPNPEAAAKVTLEQLVGHRGGIGDFFNERFESTPHSDVRTIADYLRLFAHEPLAFPPGSKIAYSNGGYVVLGAIVEKVAGVSYEEFVRESVLMPAGMADTAWISVDEIVRGRAVGYTRHADAGGPPEGTLRANTYTLPGRGSPAGGGYATAGDLVKLAAALRDGVLLSKPWSEWILQGNDAPWPAPVGGDTPRGRLTGGGIGFGGGAPGISSAMEWEVEDDLMVVVLANLDPPIAEGVAGKVSRWAAAQP
jgi:CubicO group peptidase (beta-lactamase class C family)